MILLQSVSPYYVLFYNYKANTASIFFYNFRYTLKVIQFS